MIAILALKLFLLKTMELDLQKIKQIDVKTQYLVFGFMRQEENLLINNDNDICWTISDLIIYTILAFYAQVEFFEYFLPNAFRTVNNANIIIRIEEGNDVHGIPRIRTVYGSKVIPYESKGIHEWKIKIVLGTYIYIGIDEASRKCMATHAFDSRRRLSYAYAAFNGSKRRGKFDNFGESYGSGDTITMVLNMNDKSLSFAKNNGKLKKAYDVGATDVGYCLACFMRFTDDSLRILSYEHRDSL